MERDADQPDVAVRRKPRPTAAREFPCPSCGASLKFTPGQHALTCAYCGHVEEVPHTAEAIREYDLNDALHNRQGPSGWGRPAQEIRCQQCGAVTVFSGEQSAGACAFCGSSRVVAAEAEEDLIRPESLIAFVIDRDRAFTLFGEWLRGLWFRPNALKQAGDTARLSGVYLPYWTFDSATSSWWTADAGYYYYETETYTTTDAQGRRVTRTRQVQKTRWVPASGFHPDFFDDVLIDASLGLTSKLLRGILPFDLDALENYDPGYLAGYLAERYQVDLPDAWTEAQSRMESALYSRCAAEVPGDTHRNLSVNTAFSGSTFKHLLLPVWVSAYQYGGRAYRFLVNGQTGEVTGEAPWSWWKIIGFILLLAALGGVIYLVAQLSGG